jgi:MFS transporter, putative metabolite:H+ symporter
LGSLALVPAMGTAALETAVPVALGLALLSLYGHETRGRDLRELERSQAMSA